MRTTTSEEVLNNFLKRCYPFTFFFHFPEISAPLIALYLTLSHMRTVIKMYKFFSEKAILDYKSIQDYSS